MRTSLLSGAVVLAALSIAPSAVAQEASPDERTVVASGLGRVLVQKPAAKTEAAAQKVVDAADRAAETAAVRNAQVRAASLAGAAGLTLGPLLRVDEGELGMFALFVDVEDDDEEGAPYCRRRVVRETRRRLIRRHRCQVPRTRLAYARVTYAVGG